MMKKLHFLLIILFFNVLFLNALELPENLAGIWEGKDRIIFFENSEDVSEPQIVVILKEYYGWYYDRAAEPQEYNQKEKRIRNTGTTRTAQNIFIGDISTIISKTDNEAYLIKLNFSKNQFNYIPVCILNHNLYLNFMIQDDVNKSFYKGFPKSKGFLISEQIVPENISAYIIDKNKFYDVRYWKSGMEYSNESVLFKYENDEYNIPKHIFTSEYNYSCVTGRSKKVRNPVKSFDFSENSFTFNADKSVLILDNEPYLTKIADKNTFEDLMTIVKTANSRRKPDPEPVFPPDDVNWHWDLIDLLEKDNALIQAVRERQRNFGPRPKDLN